MKTNKIFKGLSVIVAAGLLTSCSSDYLDLAPETDISNATVTSSVESAALAINGISNAMQTQWGGLQSGMSQNANGENLINQFYGEAYGQDAISGIPEMMWGDQIICGGVSWAQDNYVMNYLPWKYAYTIIQEANLILNGIDDAEGSDEDKAFIKAQALTFRAHGYHRLVQFYAPRWENSDNGNWYCAVKRLDGDNGDAPLMTMNETFDLIYSDLNQAIELYKSSEGKRALKWHPDLNVAYGILARAALIKHDWATAKEAAHNARQGYEIMSNSTYFAGFLDDNNSTIWTQATEPADIYYFSFGAHYGVNGAYTQSWNYSAGSINIDLYNQLDPNDVRRQMYLTPDKIEVLGSNPSKTEPIDFWNKDLVQPNGAGFMDLSKGPNSKNAAINGKWGVYNIAIRYCKHYGENIFNGDYAAMANPQAEGDFYAYYTSSATPSEGAVLIAKGEYGKLSSLGIGAQFKFWGIPPYGVSSYPFMRAEEMCLIEAEAACELGDEGTAKSCLMEIQGLRIPGYTCDKSGTALRDEIRLARRIELWGEGFNWFDFKRWNIDIKRRAWVENDPTSGNWTTEFAHDTPADCNNGWCMLIPYSEFAFNAGIDKNLLKPNNNVNQW